MFRRLAAPRYASDFVHHAPGIARLNNGSFGASPQAVLDAEAEHRARWRANPDAFYFGVGSTSLDARVAAAAKAAAGALSAPDDSVSLVENATVCTAIIAQRWARSLRERPSNRSNVLLLDVCYKAVAYSIAQICEPAGAQLHFAHVPFPDTSVDAVLSNLDKALRDTSPRYVMLDHVSSQPALVLPVQEMVALCKRHGVEEVAVDGAHGVGLLPPSALRVTDIGATFYFTNLHKWAFAPSPVAALHAAEHCLQDTHHVVPSWQAGSGLFTEARWPGTRDFAPVLAVPDALAYLAEWRSADGLDVVAHNAEGYRRAESMLREAWGVDPAVAEPALLSDVGMGMVRLPPTLDLSNDRPGQPSAGVRQTLRDEFRIEAAVGGFGDEGGFLRLSHAVYSADEDFERLCDAVSELARRSR